MCVPAWYFLGWQTSQVDSTLTSSNVASLLSSRIAASQEHLPPSSLGSVLGDAEKGRKVVAQLVFVDPQVVVEEVEELLLHEVDFGLGE